LEHPVTERLAAFSRRTNKEVSTIDKTMKCQFLVFSYLFEVEPLQGHRGGCFDSFSADSSRLCAHSFACRRTKSSRHVHISVMWQLGFHWICLHSCRCHGIWPRDARPFFPTALPATPTNTGKKGLARETKRSCGLFPRLFPHRVQSSQIGNWT